MLRFKQLSHFFEITALSAFLFFSTLTLGSLANDRVGSNKMPASNFWSDVYPLGTIDFQGSPDTAFSNRNRFWYHLYREADGDWFLMGNGNGQLWRLDTNLHWNRVDNTFFMGCDFRSYLLYPGMKYGGYGYWKTNGMLFHYREKIGEWELVPLSKELPVFGEYCYYDVRRNVLIQCGSYIVNESQKEKRMLTDSLFELDLMNRNWTTIGRLNPAAVYFLNPANMLMALETPVGRWLYSNVDDTCAFVDYLNRRCIIPNKNQRITFFKAAHLMEEGKMLVSTRKGILLVDTTDFSIIDSLLWSRLILNPELNVPVLFTDNPASSRTIYFYFVPLGILVVGGGWILYRRRHLRNNFIGDFNQQSSEHVGNPFVLEEHDGRFFYNGTDLSTLLQDQEVNLIRILIEKKREGQKLNTLQFNELLEIDSRSPDNQKKIRSEVVKGVNIGLQRLGFPYEAVCRIRLEEDRRMMVYFLHEAISV